MLSNKSKVRNAIRLIKPGSSLNEDRIIDLYKLAKSECNEDLMKLVKTLKLKETIKHSELKKVIKEIVKGIFKEMTSTGAVSPVSTPKAFKKTNEEETIDEITTTGDVSGYNVPSAFSRKGGSHKGVEGSSKLGYNLTPIGKKEMERQGDQL